MTQSDQSNTHMPATLAIAGGPDGPVNPEPLDARVAVTSNRQLLIQLESGVTWVLAFERAPAAYVSGRLALAAGVQFGEWFSRAISELEEQSR